ncbi:MAG: hypothetical protein M1281_10170 [Chloroflexi bacterium]|nr:hypothetical protein [Chloroflexota bacterium]
MKKISLALVLVLSALMVVTAACSPQANAKLTVGNPASSTPPSNPTQAQQTYSDPFAYCAAVGTIDIPDGRYTGTQVPEEIITGFKKAAGLEASTEPMNMFQKTTIWRCMTGKVYACNFGANLPCNSKANTDKIPSQAMDDFCKANPDAEVIPMSVTGHSTIYSWHCLKDTPELLNQIEKVDAEGYLEQIWYAIEPAQ